MSSECRKRNTEGLIVSKHTSVRSKPLYAGWHYRLTADLKLWGVTLPAGSQVVYGGRLGGDLIWIETPHGTLWPQRADFQAELVRRGQSPYRKPKPKSKSRK